MKAAAIQFEIIPGQVAQNQQKVAELVAKAADLGAELVVLPELWPTGYCLEQLPELAESMRGSSILLLRKLAKEHQICLVGGSIAEKKDNKFYNTSLIVNKNGDISVKYRKVHLYPHGLLEHLYFSPGESWSVSEYQGWQIGQMICYDLFFPEFARNLALRGAQILTLPAQITNKAYPAFKMLAQARALENQCYLILANASNADSADDDALAGQSLIISPQGEILAAADKGKAIIVAELKIELLQWLKANRNPLEDRRPFLDEIDDSQI